MVNLNPKYGGPMLPEEFIRRHSRSEVAVIEGDDPVLQELTGTGRYYLVELRTSPNSSSVLGYYAPRSVRIECLPHLDIRPFRTLEAAEKEAARIRAAQAARLEEEDENWTGCATAPSTQAELLNGP